ncbi:MAG: DUF4232 domain-containing protein [Nevskiaceae bacterium]|nr:MAG: DUF4232 domain-containing protein [Nevskiaceae bacterium]TBR72696.1 MAG: DUF4232 domain-containing protein [Nevskiaceae bacterium]
MPVARACATAGLAAATLAAACAPLPQVPAPDTTPATCTAAGLRLDPAGRDAGMGHRALAFRYTNASPRPCSLGGYPEVRALDVGGKPLAALAAIPATRATRSYLVPDGDAATRVVQPGQGLWFAVTWSVIPHGNAPCPAMAALRITPPGAGTATGGVVVPAISSVCAGLHVLPLRTTPTES